MKTLTKYNSFEELKNSDSTEIVSDDVIKRQLEDLMEFRIYIKNNATIRKNDKYINKKSGQI